jgi:hypothetical protein
MGGPALLELLFGMLLLGAVLALVAWVLVQVFWGVFVRERGGRI